MRGTKTCCLWLVLIVVEISNVRAQEVGNSGPQRVWGDLSSTYRVWDRDSGRSTDTNFLNTGTINASSYVWRPWFALISGGLSFSVEQSQFEEQSDVKNEFITGRAQFDLFPSSRFPFMLYYNEDRSKFDDDRSDLVESDLDVANTEYGAQQKYRSLDGKHNYSALYRRNEQDNNGGNQAVRADFSADRLLFSASNQFDENAFNTDIDVDRVDEDLNNRQAEIYAITATHSYQKNDANLSLNNLLATSKIENDFSDSNSDENSYQLNSFLSWQPLSRDDIKLTGSLRAARNRIAQSQSLQGLRSDIVDNEISTANINQGLIYEYSDNLLFSESINVNYTMAEDEDTQHTGSESVKAAYISDRTSFGIGDYGWSASTSLNNQHGDIESSQQLDNRLGHSLAKNRSVKNSYELRSMLTQAIKYDLDSADEDETRIDHALTVTWSDASTANQSVIGFTASDSRRTGQDEDLFQLVNLQYTGSFRFDRYSQLGGNLTLQYTNQENDGLRTERTVTNGQLEYLRDRLFHVPNLVFRSKLRLEQEFNNRESFVQDLNEDTGIDASWKNTIRHKIGRLESEFSLDFLVNNDRFDRLIKFQLKRSFGDL